MSGIILKKVHGSQPISIKYENQAKSSPFNVANVRIAVGDILPNSSSQSDCAKNYIAHIEDGSLWK